MRLTELSKSGGCGCKVAPAALRDLLLRVGMGGETAPQALLVGAENADDAAVWKINDDTAIIASADFFAPLVDVPGDFGRIAAANALSDIYAMGGKPLFALALSAMPRGVLSDEIIAEILAGGRTMCEKAGVIIAGGHSIETSEPLYGLAVLGVAHPNRLLTNGGGVVGDVLLLGKPLGVGVLSASHRRGQLSAENYAELLSLMTQLNDAGYELAGLSDAHAMTDVTGFGLLGHLLEICRSSDCAAQVDFARLPVLAEAVKLAAAGVVTAAAARNWDSYGDEVILAEGIKEWQKALLTDPQTSGGLLLCCAPHAADAALHIFHSHGCTEAAIIGRLCAAEGAARVTVNNY